VNQLPAHRRGKLLLSLLTDYAALFAGTVNGTPSAALMVTTAQSSRLFESPPLLRVNGGM